MKDLTKMMIFMFLGLLFAILVLGFHKSPSAQIGSPNEPRATPEITSMGL